MITRINESTAAAGKSEELYAFLKSLVPYITASEGNRGCEVLHHSDDPSRFVVIERWDSPEAHRKSIENYPKVDRDAVMHLFGTPPPSANNYHD